jgi:hypothetical protein
LALFGGVKKRKFYVATEPSASQWERRRLGGEFLPGHPRRRDASGPKGCKLARLSVRKSASSADNQPGSEKDLRPIARRTQSLDSRLPKTAKVG